MSARLDIHWDERAAQAPVRQADTASRTMLDQTLEMANRDAPLLTGAMIRSSLVTDAYDGTYAIEYHVPYAFRQHQTRRYRHTRGRAFWLRDAVDKDPSQLERLIARAMGGFL